MDKSLDRVKTKAVKGITVSRGGAVFILGNTGRLEGKKIGDLAGTIPKTNFSLLQGMKIENKIAQVLSSFINFKFKVIQLLLDWT